MVILLILIILIFNFFNLTAPQYVFTGTGYDLPLLKWLEKQVLFLFQGTLFRANRNFQTFNTQNQPMPK